MWAMKNIYKAIFRLSIIFLISLAYKKVMESDSDIYKSFEQIVKERGYPLETYNVATEDGYNLGLFRIPRGKGEVINTFSRNRNGNGNKPIAFLLHGIMDSADAFITNQEEKAIAFRLANQGYDVWIGNSRGNKYSRSHKALNAEYEEEFWDYTFHEMGMFDLPANFDFILNKTKQQKLNYIGHSQGTTQLFAAMSTNPDYFKKVIKNFVALAPVTALKGLKSDTLKFFIEKEVAKSIGQVFHEFVPVPPITGKILSFLCDSPLMPICDMVFNLFSEINPSEEHYDRFLVYLSRLPSSCSTKALLHFDYLHKNKDFVHFDYGKEKNLKIYGQSSPSRYNLENVKDIGLCMIVAKRDKLSTLEDNRDLKEKMNKNKVLKFYKEYDNLGHHSFFYGSQVDWLDDLVEYLNKNS